MTNFQACLTFKPIKENAYEKERERKLEDQRKWTACFDGIVGSYFDTHTFRGVHKEFIIEKDRLDCFVPSRGTFICQQFGKPGTKPTKNKIEEPEVEEGGTEGEQRENEDQNKSDQAKSEEGGEQKKNDDQNTTGRRKKGIKVKSKNGCGRNWNSNLCLTKFVCTIEDNKLYVDLREYGQRCEHCTKKYENPSFKPHVLEIMITWLLDMIVQGIFDVVDQSIVYDPDDMGYFTGRRHWQYKSAASTKKTHDSSNCEACVNNKQCGCRRKKVRPKKRRNRRGRGNQPPQQQQQQRGREQQQQQQGVRGHPQQPQQQLP